jgi:hypothetical protein
MNMKMTEAHKIAECAANANTRMVYGDDSVPCNPGSAASKHWLIIYHDEINELSAGE